MAKEAFQLSDEAVAAYEEQKVKSMFGPLALAILETVPISVEDTTLDLACGTGIVSRSILQNENPNRPVFGIAIKAVENAEPGSVILFMLPDTGERYMSTPLFESIAEDMDEEETELSKSTPGHQLD